jgi:predicted nucleic acid-binding Zn ribbon protein
MTAVQAQPPPTDPRTQCPSCGSAVDPSQPFCLDCGRRIGRDYRRPPNWRIPVALVALLVIAAGVAAGFGVTQLTNKGEGPDQITVRADRPAGAAQADPGEATTQPAPAPAQPAPQAPTGPAEWPKGRAAYTIVLLTTMDKGTADATAQRATAGGLPAGVLESTDFKRFEPGLYVVFSGQFDTVEAASAEAQTASDQGNPGAYARYVEPKKK